MTDIIDTADIAATPDKPELIEGADFQTLLAGRWIAFKALSPGQLIMLQRLMNAANKSGDEGSGFMMMMSSIFTAVESTIVIDEDREFVMNAMLTAKLDYTDALRVLRQGREDVEPDDDVEVKKLVAGKKAANTRRVKK